MALRSRRDSAMIWPGFVDAVTTLLMVMMFVLTIFTVMQAVLRDTITTQGAELGELNAQVAQLADALGLERKRAEGLQADFQSSLLPLKRNRSSLVGVAETLALLALMVNIAASAI